VINSCQLLTFLGAKQSGALCRGGATVQGRQVVTRVDLSMSLNVCVDAFWQLQGRGCSKNRAGISGIYIVR
jgi:hypothetical protein